MPVAQLDTPKMHIGLPQQPKDHLNDNNKPPTWPFRTDSTGPELSGEQRSMFGADIDDAATSAALFAADKQIKQDNDLLYPLNKDQPPQLSISTSSSIAGDTIPSTFDQNENEHLSNSPNGRIGSLFGPFDQLSRPQPLLKPMEIDMMDTDIPDSDDVFYTFINENGPLDPRDRSPSPIISGWSTMSPMMDDDLPAASPSFPKLTRTLTDVMEDELYEVPAKCGTNAPKLQPISETGIKRQPIESSSQNSSIDFTSSPVDIRTGAGAIAMTNLARPANRAIPPFRKTSPFYTLIPEGGHASLSVLNDMHEFPPNATVSPREAFLNNPIIDEPVDSNLGMSMFGPPVVAINDEKVGDDSIESLTRRDSSLSISDIDDIGSPNASGGPPKTINTDYDSERAIAAHKRRVGQATHNNLHRCEWINPATDRPCNKNFSRPYDLVRHQETIHAKHRKTYRCELCGDHSKQFSRPDAVTRHRRVKHNIMS
ncbi:hypothetical protein CANCADRAFT_32779 [Tortispora caseinolytica NRRL Y-17796]|uniref:C2H2-type domain-containing protein n=1 Tax=Tortispora caseinolytica NRRL Y-17796 TaxID=767744 RepID=A0A1E4TCY1_9ASCO|nr:hypothetical protein CANCADRAFT_32779 [Tortispora caseinolytica NRRL Y-17796]